jgi:iron complex outermembrane receptor protein
MRYLLALLLLTVYVHSSAQNTTLSGKIIDNYTEQEVVGAKITLQSKSKLYRALSDPNGNYSIDKLVPDTYSGFVTMLSFDTLFFSVELNQGANTLNHTLGGSQELEEVKVIGNLVVDRKTPVAVTRISTKQINEELGSRDLPMILNSSPGVYATQQGGGDGDARITIRGFSQRNVGVMIDGVPVNDMENGWVYWSNWFGLDAITGQIQLQRGLGATKLAMPSVGGTMNIITQATGGKRMIKVGQEYGTGEFLRTSLSYKSGTLKNGWGVLFSGSYKQGNGWVDGLTTQGAFYYLKIQKKIKNHIVSLSGFGAPQRHGQRSYRQGISYWSSKYGRNMFEGSDDLYNVISRFRNDGDSVAYLEGLELNGLDTSSVQPFMTNYVDTSNAFNNGISYNEHWGYRRMNGKNVVFNERRNYYHKPQITLKDFWKINDKLSWSNIVYTSIGRGGGQRYFNSASTIIYDEQG